MKIIRWISYFNRFKPVGTLSSTISSSGILSKYLINARSELPCAHTSTLEPERIDGTI